MPDKEELFNQAVEVIMCIWVLTPVRRKEIPSVYEKMLPLAQDKVRNDIGLV